MKRREEVITECPTILEDEELGHQASKHLNNQGSENLEGSDMISDTQNETENPNNENEMISDSPMGIESSHNCEK